MPRSPRFRLWFDIPAQSALTVRAWLLEGPAGEATLEDLAAADGASGVRERTRVRLVPLALTQGTHFVDGAPTLPLAASRDYSLVFTTPSGLTVRALRTSDAASAGAAPTATFPSRGAGRVPRDQADVLWLFDGNVTGEVQAHLAGGLTDTALPLDGTGCAARGFPAERCRSASLPAPLAPATDYVAELEGTLSDGAGATLSVLPIVFTTGRAEVGEPIALGTPRCGPGEVAQASTCLRLAGDAVRVRASSATPVSGCLVGCGAEACAPSSLDTLELTLTRRVFDGCPAVLRLIDGARSTFDVALAIAAAPGALQLSISEARPAGSGEGSTRSYVELLNFGSAPVSLRGATLITGAESHGVTIDETSPVGPGERVLLVSADFAAGPPVADAGAAGFAPDVRLVRLARPLALGAAGSALTLLDAQGRYSSGAPALAAPFPGACLVRSGADLRSDAREAFAVRAPADCSPGRAEP
jgi:hypothetical protein